MTQLGQWLRKQARRSPRLHAALRSIKQGLSKPGGGGEQMPREAFRARLAIQGALPALEIAGAGTMEVDVTNASPCPWPGEGLLALSYHWRRSDGSVWAHDHGRTPLPASLEPGQSVRVACALRAPHTPATYTLELDVVYGADGWFGQAGSPSLRQDIVVAGFQPDTLAEVDYEQIYANADLSKDYWTVSGPGSAEEFAQLSHAKLRLLTDQGLAPGSRVLDVGCGTGMVALALQGFLGSEGRYFGTDLSEVAVQYCRDRYGHPNFEFARNGMTTLPLEGRRFDFIVFFSVFTHTYPEETRALLAEAVRLLDDQGVIVADVFESDIEGDSLGTRAMIVLDRPLMLRMAEEQGLEARMLSTFVWDPTGRRPIDRVMRRFSKARATERPRDQQA